MDKSSPMYDIWMRDREQRRYEIGREVFVRLWMNSTILDVNEAVSEALEIADAFLAALETSE